MVVRFNRPDKLNVLNASLLGELTGCLRGLAGQSDVRCVVLGGEGRAFCAGGDLDDLYPRLSGGSLEEARQHIRSYQLPVAEIRALSCPVIAAVNGLCAGAAISLVLSCDLVVAVESAKFVSAFARAGLVPDLGALHLWARALGPQRAKEWAMLSTTISAAEAHRAGMVNRVVPDGAALTAALELARQIAMGPPVALAMIKTVINTDDDEALEDVLRLEAFAQAAAFRSGEVDEGVAAFYEKRAPRFAAGPTAATEQ